jgi:hypothetical protein
LLLLATFFIIPSFVSAQPAPKKTRILFLLDGSSSMTYTWNEGYSRFDVASTILLSIMDSIYSLNNEIEFAVRAYGTKYPAQLQNCTDTELEVPFNIQNARQIKTRLRNLVPIGSSPIAFSLMKASDNELFDHDKYDYSVIFITDGGESCNGDVCGIYQKLLQRKISIKPYIIGLDKNETLKSYYACLGNYIEVSTTAEIDEAIRLIVEANRSIIEKPKQLNVVTQYSNVEPVKVVPKVDTVIPPPPIKRDDFSYRLLEVYRMPVRRNETKQIIFPATRLKRVKTVSLAFEYTEEKKQEAVWRSIVPMLKANVLKNSAAKTPPSKNKLPIAKKVIVEFEYEEAKKISPTLLALNPSVRSTPIPVAGVSTMKAKSNLRITKKVSVAFEYVEPKKISPPLDPIKAGIAVITLKPGKAALATSKNKLKVAKKVSVEFEYEEIKKIDMARIKPIMYPRRYTYANRLPNPNPRNRTFSAVTIAFAVEEKKDVAKKDTVMAPVDFPNNSVEYTTEVKASTGTTVQVFFLGTNGKTYPTAKPMIHMQDVKSNQTITSFTRDMNGNEPVAQNVPPGKYNLVIKGFDDLYANNIVIEPNTLTKVIVKVNDGTLKFTYQGNIKRPMVEYTAIVNRRFAAGANVIQKCSESRMYEPGTYYVEVNTLPAYKASIDLNFDAIYEIQIPESGTLVIMNDKPLGKIQIQSMLGDQYVTFHTMNITGNMSEQRVNLRPLQYKILYPADPNMPQAGLKEVPVRIRSNNQTELELR